MYYYPYEYNFLILVIPFVIVFLRMLYFCHLKIYPSLFKLESASIRKKYFKIPLFLAIMVAINSTPTKEIMTCNENYYCTIKKTYFGILTTNSNFYLNPNSKLSCKTGFYCGKTDYGNHKTKWFLKGLYVKYDKIAPFAYQIANDYGMDSYTNSKHFTYYCNSLKKQYENYTKEPKQGYTIQSKAGWDSIFNLFIACDLLYIIFLLLII